MHGLMSLTNAEAVEPPPKSVCQTFLSRQGGPQPLRLAAAELFSMPVELLFLERSYKRNNTVCSLCRLAAVTQHNASEPRPCVGWMC